MFLSKKNNYILKLILVVFLIITMYVVNLYQKNSYIYNKELLEKEQIHMFKRQYTEKATDNIEVNPIIRNIKNTYIIEDDIQEMSTTQDYLSRKEYKKEELSFVGDCIIEIPKIQLQKIVYSGTDRESHLDEYELITATNDMLYENGGNYIICGHASQLYGHSLNRIKELQSGDKIIIYTQTSKDVYIINSINYINQQKTSLYCNQTQEPIITILSCARYISENSYIVIKASKL